jgi:hypothetical protein
MEQVTERFPIGVIHEGRVYAADEFRGQGIAFGQAVSWNYVAHLWIAPIVPKDLQQTGPAEFHIDDGFQSYHGPLRWRIAFGHWWSTNAGTEFGDKAMLRITLDDLPFFLPQRLQGRPEREKKYRGKSTNWWYDPIATIAPPDGKPGPVFDFLPTHADRGLLFVVYQRQLSIWEAKGVPNDRPFGPGRFSTWDVKWEEKKDLAIRGLEFSEPFQVFAQNDRWFFLTTTGKLYIIRDEKQGGPGMARWWTEDDSPISALVTDTATGKTYAFTAPKPGVEKGRSVYFELAEPLGPKPYSVKPVDGINMVPSLKRTWELAHVLLAEGKIRVPADQPAQHSKP